MPKIRFLSILFGLFLLACAVPNSEGHLDCAAGSPDPPDSLSSSSSVMSLLLKPLAAAKKIVTLSKIDYNRVEGLFLGVSPPRLMKANFELFGNAGYGFESSAWRYEVGLMRSWFWMNRLEIGTAYYDLTDSQDRWIISGLENTLAALLLREDFMDYYERRGMRFFAIQNISEIYRFGLEFRADHYDSMTNRTNWSVFGGDKKFRRNPGVAEGRMRSLMATAQADFMGYREGWIFQGEYEKAGDPFGGRFDFHRLWIQGKRYQQTFGRQQAVFHLMAGFHKGTLPEQRLYDLGGIETLRGYRFKEFSGANMLLGNIYYLFGNDLFARTGIPVVRSLQPILFSDAGAAFNRFRELRLADLKTDVGVAIADLENTFRINVAKRLDRSDDSVRITVRLLRKF